MAKPTVLLEIDPFLLASPSVPEFIHESISMAQKFEDQFGGISVKLTGSTSISVMAEFRWQGFTVIKAYSLGSRNKREEISVYYRSRVISPSTFFACDLAGIFDSAFLDILEEKLAKLNELKLNLQNRKLTREEKEANFFVP